MYLEFYYFNFPLVEKFKEDTLIESIKQDLNKFFIYHFWETINQTNLFISSSDNYQIPKLIFQINKNLTNQQIQQLIDIFSAHWEENFILNTDLPIKENKFLKLNNINNILNQANNSFEKFIKYYQNNKVIDETSPTYKNFRKSYNLLLFLNYFLTQISQKLSNKQSEIKTINPNLVEYQSNLQLLAERLNLTQKSILQTLPILQQYTQKLQKIFQKIK